MKDLFKGYAPKTEDEKRVIWEQCIFTFDTNVLLNLYRYSENTKAELLQIIDRLQNKVWLSHQAAYEFNVKRLTVLDEQIKEYDKLTKAFNSIKDLMSNKRHPFLTEDLSERLDSLHSDINLYSIEKQKEIKKLIFDDEIYLKVSSIFKDKIGKSFTRDEITSLDIEGKDRYDKKIPPGYQDAAKLENKYGDFYLWKQVLDYAKSEQKPIILITNDAKEDWWLKNGGEKIGPRTELIQEIWDHSQVDFLLLTADNFLKQASDFLKAKVNEVAVQEIKDHLNSDSYISAFSNNLSNIISNSYAHKYNFDSIAKVLNDIKFDSNFISVLKNVNYTNNHLITDDLKKAILQGKLASINLKLSSIEKSIEIQEDAAKREELIIIRNSLILERYEVLAKLAALDNRNDSNNEGEVELVE